MGKKKKIKKLKTEVKRLDAACASAYLEGYLECARYTLKAVSKEVGNDKRAKAEMHTDM